MIIKHSQQDIVINFDNNVKDIALKISGGADSAILCYILGLYKKKYRPDINIHTITSDSNLKPYQVMFADRIIEKVSTMLDIKFGNRYTNTVNSLNYADDQFEFLKSLRLKKCFEFSVTGETKNPPIALDTICEPPTGRSGENMPTLVGNGFKPFRNIDKKGIKELYDTLGVLEDLFPLTRSCEEFPTTDFSKHCEKCWFCAERFWGFGRYV